LLKKTEHVLVCPFLRKLALCDAMYDRRGHFELVACPWNAGKVALVRAAGGETRHDFVAFRDLILDPMVARGGGPEQRDALYDALAAGCQPRKGGGE
jgi:hypothetical protein